MDAQLHEKSLDFSEDNNTIYDKWADTYETYVSSIGYLGPTNFSHFFRKLLEKSKIFKKQKLRILDFGCGTGLLGLNVYEDLKLKENIEVEIVGVDISEKMLEKAKDKNVYNEIININILDVELNEVKKTLGEFDFIISCGVFLEGHVPFTIFSKLKEIVKQNIIFTVRESFIHSRNDEYNQYVKANENYKEYDIEYLDNVKCKLVVI